MRSVFLFLGILAIVLGVLALAACDQPDSKIVSQNLSKAADMFEINRRVIFYNGITDSYMLTIEGLCSVDNLGNRLAVTCKVGAGRSDYKKHFLGLSDNVTYFVEQLEPATANAYHYRVIFKPQSILPDLDVRGSARDLPPPTLNR